MSFKPIYTIDLEHLKQLFVQYDTKYLFQEAIVVISSQNGDIEFLEKCMKIIEHEQIFYWLSKNPNALPDRKSVV